VRPRRQRVQPERGGAVAGSGGDVAFRIPVPFEPALPGVRFYNQAFVPDAGANALGAVVSDAAAAVVGG
jgi:hypothetical protein